MGNTNHANIQTNRVTVQNFSVVKTTRPSEASFLVTKKRMKGYIIKNVTFNMTDKYAVRIRCQAHQPPHPQCGITKFLSHPATQFIMAEKKPSKL
jgi:hypothetical protein